MSDDSSVVAKAKRLLAAGAITEQQFADVVVSDAKFHVEAARAERDDALRQLADSTTFGSFGEPQPERRTDDADVSGGGGGLSDHDEHEEQPDSPRADDRADSADDRADSEAPLEGSPGLAANVPVRLKIGTTPRDDEAPVVLQNREAPAAPGGDDDDESPARRSDANVPEQQQRRNEEDPPPPPPAEEEADEEQPQGGRPALLPPTELPADELRATPKTRGFRGFFRGVVRQLSTSSLRRSTRNSGFSSDSASEGLPSPEPKLFVRSASSKSSRSEDMSPHGWQSPTTGAALKGGSKNQYASSSRPRSGGAMNTSSSGTTTGTNTKPAASRLSEQPYAPSDFERLRRVGVGGFGVVYLVRKRQQPRIGRLYAMKVLRKDVVLRAGGVSRAKLERDVLRYVRHKFVARLRYAFQTETRLYLVTDFYPGGNLKSLLRSLASRAVAPNEAAFYAAELSLALGYLHSKGIVHRDVKPSNVLLDRRGHLALCDFGIAAVCEKPSSPNNPQTKDSPDRPKATNRTSAVPTRDEFAGTVAYVAPELLRGGAYGPPVDWWALGVLTFELVHATTPFASEKPRDLFKNILFAEPAFAAASRDDDATVAGPFVDFVRGLLRKDASKRFGKREVEASAFLAALDLEAVLEKRVAPPRAPKLPPYYSFDDEGKLRCDERSTDLPKLDSDGESDLEEAEPRRRRGSAPKIPSLDDVPHHHKPSEASGARPRSARVLTPENAAAFKGFSYAGDHTFGTTDSSHVTSDSSQGR